MRAIRLGTAVAAVAALAGIGGAAPVSAAPAPGTARIIAVKQTVGGDGGFLFHLINVTTGGQVAQKLVATSDGVGTSTFSTDVPPGTYKLSEDAQPGWSTSVSCDGGQNADEFTVVEGQTVTCTFTNTATTSLSKLVTSGPTLVAGHTDQFDIGYTLTLINTSPVAQITIGDFLDFGPGVAVISGPTLVSPPAALTPNATWNGTISNVILGTATMSLATTMIINFTARVQLAPGTTLTARDCTRDAGEVGTGTLNLAIISIAPPAGAQGTPGIVFDTVCAPLSTLTLQAQIVNDNGGTLALSGVTLTATAGSTVISGAGFAQGAVGTAALTLAGTDVAGYTKSAYTCTGGTLAGAALTVTPGADAVCTIVYDDIASAATTTTTANTLPPTGARGAGYSAGAGVLLLGLGGLLVLIAGVRRRGAST